MDKFENDIKQCIAVLKDGGTILYPTDTIWGIGCDATNESAIEKIIHLKNRPENKSFVVLVATEKQLLQYVASLDLAIFNYLDTAKKPTTVIYDYPVGLAQNALSEKGSVAIRICKDEFCKHLIKRFGKPIISTSANVSGELSPLMFKHISQKIIKGVNYVVQHRQTENTATQASAIIKWENGNAVIIRA